jgi:hypothetical protein
MWGHLRTALVLCFVTGLVGTAVLAQVTNYAKLDATVGKPLQLGYYASAHKNNCTAAALPTVRVITPPKSGTLMVRRAQLMTDKVQGCPPMKVWAQVAFYQARAGAIGLDHLDYDVTSENGEVAIYDFTISVQQSSKLPTTGDNENKI